MPTLQLAIDAGSSVAEARRFQTALLAIDQAAMRVDRSVGTFEAELVTLGRRLDRTERAADRTGDEFSQMGRQVRDADSQVRRAGAGAITAQRGFGGLVRILSGTTAAFAGIAAARGTVRVIADFEQSMAELRSVAISTNQSLEDQQKQYADLQAAAREAGATTRFTAAESSQALLFLARAGFDAEESINALAATQDLAIAGQLDLARSADLVSNVMQAFQLETTQTAEAADLLVRTANGANTNVEQLGQALSLVGPVANAAGRGLGETTAALGVLGDAGIQASLAGTSLRGILLALSAPTEAAASALDQMNLSAEELNPATNSLTEIFARLRDGLNALPEADRLGALNDIFGRRQAAGAAVLAEGVEKLASGFNELGATASDVATATDNTLIGSFRAFNSAIQETLIATGDSGLLGALRGITDGATTFVRALSGTGDPLDASVARARTFIDVLKILGATFAGLKILAFVQGLTSSVAAFSAATTAAGGLGSAAGLLGAALPIAAVAGLTVGVGLLTSRLIEARSAARSFAELSELISSQQLDLGGAGGVQELRATVRAEVELGNPEAAQDALQQQIDALGSLETQLEVGLSAGQLEVQLDQIRQAVPEDILDDFLSTLNRIDDADITVPQGLEAVRLALSRAREEAANLQAGDLTIGADIDVGALDTALASASALARAQEAIKVETEDTTSALIQQALAQEEAANSVEGRAAAQQSQQQNEALASRITQLQQQTALLGQAGLQQRLLADAQKLGIEVGDERLAQLEQELIANSEAQASRDITTRINQLQQEQALIGLTRQEIEAINAVTIEGVASNDVRLNQIREELALTQQLKESAGIQERVSVLQEERSLIGLIGTDLALAQEAQRLGLEIQDERLGLLREELDLTAQANAENSLEEILAGLQQENELLMLGNQERQIRRALLEAEGLAGEAGSPEADRLLADIEAVTRANQELEDAARGSARNVANEWTRASQQSADAFAEGFRNIVEEGQDTGDVLKNVALQIAESYLQAQLTSAGTGATAGGGGGETAFFSALLGAFGGFRADGGSVQAGQAYITGERGREVFVPSRKGKILNSSQTKSYLATDNSTRSSTLNRTTHNHFNYTLPAGVAPGDDFGHTRRQLDRATARRINKRL